MRAHPPPPPPPLLGAGRGVEVLQRPAHQVQAPRHQDVDLRRLPQERGLGSDAVLHRRFPPLVPVPAGQEDGVPALGGPLQGAEDAGEHQRFCPPPEGRRGQAGVPDEEGGGGGSVVVAAARCRRLPGAVVVPPPAALVVQATPQHVLHRHVEVLLVCGETHARKRLNIGLVLLRLKVPYSTTRCERD